MFNQIFGKYLIDSGRLTEKQVKEVIEAEASVRVKLGLIAVAEKLLTKEQADEINQLQAIMDKRFGDIAVMKGYLNEETVASLLKKQANVYMLFCQTLIDKGFMTLDEVDEALADYQSLEGFTHSDMDDLVSGDVDRTVRIFLPQDSVLDAQLCGIMIRTVLRVINENAYVTKAFMVNEITVDNFAMQKLEGDHNIYAGFAGACDSLLNVAEPFAQEEFDTVDLDALDAVGEFINCVNGLFASDLSLSNINVDMIPPQYYDKPVKITGEQICVFPVVIGDEPINFILSANSDITITPITEE